MTDVPPKRGESDLAPASIADSDDDVFSAPTVVGKAPPDLLALVRAQRKAAGGGAGARARLESDDEPTNPGLVTADLLSKGSSERDLAGQGAAALPSTTPPPALAPASPAEHQMTSEMKTRRPPAPTSLVGLFAVIVVVAFLVALALLRR